MKACLGLIVILSVAICAFQYAIPGSTYVAAARGAHTFAFVQAAENAACASGSSTCVVTPTSTTAVGNLILVFVKPSSGSLRTITGVNCGVSWAPLNGSLAILYSTGVAVDAAYVLSATAACSSLTITLNSSGGTSVWNAGMMEFSYTPTSPSVASDSSGATSWTSQTPVPGIALTLSGTSDLIFQQACIAPSKNITAISSYTQPAPFSTAAPWSAAYLLNTASGAAPSWTVSGTTYSALDAVAFK